MNQCLKKLLELINFDSSYNDEFNSVKNTSLVLSKKDKLLNIKMEVNSVLNVTIYFKLLEALDKSKIKYHLDMIILDKASINDLILNIYYCGILDYYFKEIPSYELLRKVKLKLIDNKIVITLQTKILLKVLKELNLEKYLNACGFNYSIDYQVLEINEEELSKKIEEEHQKFITKGIEEIKQEEVKQQPSMERKPSFEKGSYKRPKAVELKMSEISNQDMNFITTGRIFDVQVNTTRNGTNIYTIYFTDNTDSLQMKLRPGKYSEDFIKSLKEDVYIKCSGDMSYDNFARDYLFIPKNIEVVEHKEEYHDVEGLKRVELHVHTKLSTMDGIGSIDQYVKKALKYGMNALALTDHGGIQAFPAFQKASKGLENFKPLYGMEGYVIEDKLEPVYNPSHIALNEATFVSLDLETTGLSQEYDRIIEFGAVKIKSGMVVETFQTFINPKIKLSNFTKNLTNISDEDVTNAPKIEEIIDKIKEFIGDSVIVAHNARFDFGFLNAKLTRMGKEKLTNTVIDTLDLAKMIFDQRSYALGAISRRLNIDYDEEIAHRADYDAKVLGDVLVSMLHTLETNYNIKYIDEISSIEVKDLYKKMRPFHVTILAQNMKGIRNLYNLVSESHIKYVTDVPLIPRSLLTKYHEGLLYGSSCYNGEIFDSIQTKDLNSVVEKMKFYDYIEVQPPVLYKFLVDVKKIDSYDTIIRIINDIISCAKKANKPVCATGDVHFVDESDRIYHDVYIYAKAKDARRHPLHYAKNPLKESPSYYFRSTLEMLNEFSFLDKDLAYEIVVTNTNLIANQIEYIKPLGSELCTPIIEGLDAQQYMEDLCYKNAILKYGNPLPDIVKNRLDKELLKIKENKFAVIYYLAHALVKHSNEDGYLVGSRGSVGSSLVATFSNITEVNPLPPHYICPYCKQIEWLDSKVIKSGYDILEKPCPECGQLMKGEGQDIPFETFLGINGDKVPDIDLNFSRDYQASAHNYTKVLLGEHNVFRAGTIGTVAEKTANGYAVNYFEELGKTDYREAEIHRLGKYCEGVKRTTGQHPGGIVVIPSYKTVHDFTPIQYPADETDNSWMTTHYTFHDIDQEILKLDILGHLDPYALRMLQDLTGIDLKEIPMNDEKVLSLFTSCKALGVSEEDILDENGSLGIPEFGTTVAKGILKDAKPKKFSELVQVSGLSHGTDVWKGNAQDLINAGIATLEETIGCRDDIMTYLMKYGLKDIDAFYIMESVRKGKGLKEEMEKNMVEHNIPKWYLDSCKKIKYMFPKAHACAYVMMALRVAWFKIYYPLEYYATYFSIRCDFFDIETMVKGYDGIKERFVTLKQKLKERSPDLTSKEKNGLDDVLHVALEMSARGFKILPISLEKSEATKWVVDKERNGIIPSFNSLDGLGDAQAESIVKARNERPFLSKKDLMERASVSKTLVAVLEKLGVLEKLSDEDQLSFDLF